MRVEVSPREHIVTAGQPLRLTVVVTNTSDVISGHQIRVLGADPDWVQLERERISLFPGTSETVGITVDLPADVPAGDRRIAVQVRELTGAQATTVDEVSLTVPGAPDVELRLDPALAHAGRTASFGLVVANRGNTTLAGPLQGSDPETKARFQFDPPRVALAPGEHAAVELRVSWRRRLTGSPVVRPFTVTVGSDTPGGSHEEPSTTTGTVVQRPVLSRGAISLVGLLAAVTVFAVVITLALSGVVGRSAADRDLALQVAAAANAKDSGGTASVAGTVRLLTSGAPVSGVTVEVFSTADLAAPVASVATDETGAYELGGLADGQVKLRFRGAGFAELWWPGSLGAADATTITLAPGQHRSGLDVRLGGLPATLAGTVLGDDVTGATVTLEAPGLGAAAATPAPGEQLSTGAALQSVVVGSDGKFALANVPSPSIYDLVVTKPGYATETQRIDLAGGESREGVQIRLRKGDGLISGTVSSADGPVGGATITASYGETTVRTVSLTEGDVGTFTLRGLPTPATVTVVFSKDGLAAQTLSLSLSPAQQLTGVGVTLANASGALAGHVSTLADGEPAGGVTVTVTNGELTRTTVTQSRDDVGAWSVEGLAVPSTYTVTFSRDDLASQTLSAALDPFGRLTTGGSASGIDVSLRSATAVLKGITSQRAAGSAASPTPVGEATITIASGAATFTTRSASVPASQLGHFEVDRIPPGTYTVSVSQPGSRPTSTIITLSAGDVREFNPIMDTPASISGTVLADGQPLAGAEVRLYVSTAYPTTVLRSVVTDASGAFAFPSLEAPASYVVEVLYPRGGTPVVSRSLSLDASEQLSLTLTVEEGLQ